MGVGATRWLEPKVRRRFILAAVSYGALVGVFITLVMPDPSEAGLAVIVAVAMAIPFFAYDFMLSYLLLERRDREAEIRVAARIQAGLFPAEVPRIGPWDCAGYLRPALSIGGDYWDVFPLRDGRVLLAVADVSGKGVPAAILMSGLRARLHLLAGQDPDPATVVNKLNRALAAETEPSEYATLILAILDAEAGTITSVNAGHPPGLLFRADGSIDQLTRGGIPVGMFEDFVYESKKRIWMPGDRLLLFSDGVLDVAVSSKGPLDPEDLIPCGASLAGGAQELVEAVRAFVHETADGEPEDDITILACTYSP